MKFSRLAYAALLALIIAGCESDAPSASPGKAAPVIELETLSVPSSNVTLEARKGKVVLIDFWATWCGPCRQISPVLEQLYEKYKDQGLEGMAITSEARDIVNLFEKKTPHKMPVLIDPNDKAARAFQATGLPTIIVVDRKGMVQFYTNGVNETTAADVEAAIQKSLNES